MKKHPTYSRTISMILVVTLVLGLLPVFASATDTTTIYFKNTNGWSDVNIYYWGGSSSVSWPGVDMELVCDDIYSFELPNDTPNVIFNNGVSQTDDLTVPTDGRDMYIYSSESWSIFCEHDWVIGTIVRAPTCTLFGKTIYTCSLCGTEKTETVPASGHDYVENICTICGLTDCGVLGHDWTEATCTTAKYCSGCKLTEGQALGHRYECTVDEESGIAVFICDLCKDSYTAPYISTGTCGDDVTWTLETDGTLMITGSGTMMDHASASDAPWYDQRSAIQHIEISGGITAIGDRAFYGCTALRDVSIGTDVTSIGNYAFRGCTVLTTITIPANVTLLEASAFRACTNLTCVMLEGSAPEIGNYVFDECSADLTVGYFEGSTGYDIAPWTDLPLAPQHVGLWTVDVPATCTTPGTRHIDCTYCQETFTGSFTVPHRYVDDRCETCGAVALVASGSCGNNVDWSLDVFGVLTVSGTGSMWNWSSAGDTPWYDYLSSIKAVDIQHGVTTIGQAAFMNCSALTSVTIPNGVTYIDAYAFKNCASLISVTIPDSVAYIEYDVFYGCSGLKSVHISDISAWLQIDFESSASNPLQNAGAVLYLNEEPVTELTIPNGITSVRDLAFYGYSSLTAVTIPDSVSSIGAYAFSGCSGLTDFTIPDSVSSIGAYAFRGCSGLTDFTIPDGISSIEEGVFSSCTGLTTITIPDSITNIGPKAFLYCSALASITISESVASIGAYAFAECTELTSIDIPDSITSIGACAFQLCKALAQIRFRGSAPTLDSSCFDGVTAEAIYPCNDETWTDDVLTGHGGTIVWKPDHRLGGYTHNNDMTCTTDETRTAQCEICGAMITDTVPNTATGHNFDENDICTACGTTKDSIEELEGKILFDNTGSGWSTPYVYVWDDDYNKLFGAWPGVPMEAMGWGIYSIEVSEGYPNIIFNEGCTTSSVSMGTQTIDLVIPEDGKNLYSFESGQWSTYTPCTHVATSVVIDPTCTEDGHTLYTCEKCGREHRDEYIAATGHNFGSNEICTICGNGKDIRIEMTDSYGDSWNGCAIEVYADDVLVGSATISSGSSAEVTIDYDPPKTYTFIWTNGSYPSECSFSIYLGDELLASGNGNDYSSGQTIYTIESACDHSYGAMTTPPTCADQGYTTYTCTLCGRSYTDDYVAASGHRYGSVTTPPTCTEEGHTTYHCSVCGYSYTADYQPSTGHRFGGWVLDQLPACTEEGYIHRTCENCGTCEKTSFTLSHHYQNGTCTTCGAADPDYAPPVEAPTLTMSHPTLSFEDEVYYNVYYTVDDASNIEEMGLITFDTRSPDGTIDDATDVISGYMASGGTYMVRTRGIPAKKLGDALYFKVYAKLSDGSYVYSSLAGYHAVAYANSILNNDSYPPDLKALMVAMLNYGAAAQIRFDHKTDDLMNADLTAEQAALVSDYNEAMLDEVVKADSSKVGDFVMNGGYSKIWPTVSFDGAFSINYYFTASNTPDDGLTFYWWDAATYDSAEKLTAGNAVGTIEMTPDGDMWFAAVEGIAAKDMDQTIYVAAAYSSNGETYYSSVISYSLGEYCESIAANDPIGAATAVYGHYAKNYFCNIE